MRTLFPVGRPVDAEDVVDREVFVRDVCRRLRDGHSVMMAGPRRIGKSSIAREVVRRLREDGLYTAQVDLFYVTSVEEFAVRWIQSVLENRTGLSARVGRAMKELRRVLSHAEIRAKLHDLELGLTLSDDEQSPMALLESAVDLAERMAERDGVRMVVVLDEFQEVERLGGQALLQRLRALFQQQRCVAYLFLGSQTTLMRALFADRRQAFYRFATWMDLPPIPEEAWRAYIERRLAEHGLRMTDAAFRLLLDRTEGHPYCVMLVAYNAHVQAELAGLREISADVADAAYEQALQQLHTIYDMQWQDLRRVKHADAVLEAVINGRPPYTLPIPRSSVGRALQELVRLSILQRGPRRGEYRLVEPMFGDWFRRQRGMN
jgi:AAA+ ATPase superfamily predicted ATPase